MSTCQHPGRTRHCPIPSAGPEDGTLGTTRHPADVRPRAEQNTECGRLRLPSDLPGIQTLSPERRQTGLTDRLAWPGHISWGSDGRRPWPVS